jgi:molecular chaperone HtpG
VSHDFEDPLTWSHNRVEGKLEYTSLLYLPARAPFDLWNRDAARGLKLYVQRTFIMDDAEQFLPLYLRFVKGVLDSNDLSLNVSREILQKDKTVDSLRSALTKRVLDMLGKLAKQGAGEVRRVLEGVRPGAQGRTRRGLRQQGEDRRAAALLHHAHGFRGAGSVPRGLRGRMQDGQDKIYYVVGENFNTARRSPQLEVFRKRGIEVLLLSTVSTTG